MQILAESELLKEQFKEEADLDLEKLLQSEESIDLIIEKLIYFRDNGFAEILFEFIFNIINEYSKIKKEKKYSNEKIENMGKLYGLIIKKDLIKEIMPGSHNKIKLYVVESLKQKSDSNLFKFGKYALLEFISILYSYPKYSIQILQIPQISKYLPEIYRYIENTKSVGIIEKCIINDISEVNTEISDSQSSHSTSVDTNSSDINFDNSKFMLDTRCRFRKSTANRNIESKLSAKGRFEKSTANRNIESKLSAKGRFEKSTANRNIESKLSAKGRTKEDEYSFKSAANDLDASRVCSDRTSQCIDLPQILNQNLSRVLRQTTQQVLNPQEKKMIRGDRLSQILNSKLFVALQRYHLLSRLNLTSQCVDLPQILNQNLSRALRQNHVTNFESKFSTDNFDSKFEDGFRAKEAKGGEKQSKMEEILRMH